MLLTQSCVVRIVGLGSVFCFLYSVSVIGDNFIIYITIMNHLSDQSLMMMMTFISQEISPRLGYYMFLSFIISQNC